MRPAPAAIDISDGLLQDLGHILHRSGVAAEVDLAAIPRSRHYRAVAPDRIDPALSGGEDYELLFCLPAGYSPAQLSRRLGIAVTRVGGIVNRKRGLWLRNPAGGLIRPAGPHGWDQLRGGNGR